MDRREMIIGSACLIAAASATALTPRKHMSLLGNAQLATLTPQQFDDWSVASNTEALVPASDDSLASTLYSQILSRIYTNAVGAQIILLIAYGPTQSNALQLHRPEECYPAFGYTLSDSYADNLKLPQGLLPMRRITASTAARTEHIAYWTRLGTDFPTSLSAQHLVRLKMALQGVIVDGLLARVSNTLANAPAAQALNDNFIRALLGAITPANRAALLGPLS